MTKILIPAEVIELTGLIQQCLLQAKEQGFLVDDIELGVSPTHVLQVIKEDESIGLVADTYTEASAVSDQEYSSFYLLNYSHQCSLHELVNR
ncbi:hypothetical protein AKJ18_30615, partial [Vibrio xuii]